MACKSLSVEGEVGAVRRIMNFCLKKRVVVWIVTSAVLYCWPLSPAHSGPYANDEIQAESPDLGSASEYLSSTEENRPAPRRRVVVPGGSEVSPGMTNDDLAVTPVPARAPASGEPQALQPPTRGRYGKEGPGSQRLRTGSSPSMGYGYGSPYGVGVGMGDDLAITPVPTRYSRPATVTPGMGDDLAVTPLPGPAK